MRGSGRFGGVRKGAEVMSLQIAVAEDGDCSARRRERSERNVLGISSSRGLVEALSCASDERDDHEAKV